MHPSDRIRFAKGYFLGNKKIALAVTGSIAAVESVKIARELIRYGADVYPYLTKNAMKFIGRDSLLFATGHAPVSELTGRDEHLDDFDLVLVSPATADVISKAACGIADDAVSTLILANLSRCVFVPAMSAKMYKNKIFKVNLEKIKRYAIVIEPKMNEGEFKIPSRERIAAEVAHNIGGRLRNKKILIVGGAGYERIDDFRIITNLSSGRTAIELAKNAYFSGADTHLLLGLHSYSIPDFVRVDNFSTLDSLISKIDSIANENYDAIIVPAALPDFRPSYKNGKIDFTMMKNVEWLENKKFLHAIRQKYSGFLVGFKAEVGTEDLIKKAKKRLIDYELNMIIANDLKKVSDNSTEVFIITDSKIEKLNGTKTNVTLQIMERIADAI